MCCVSSNTEAVGLSPVSQHIRHVSTNRSGKPPFGPSDETQGVMTAQRFAVRRDKKLLETMALWLLFLFPSRTPLLSTFMYPVISIAHKVRTVHCAVMGCAVLTSLHAQRLPPLFFIGYKCRNYGVVTSSIFQKIKEDVKLSLCLIN
jgi:hypothetical protein